jgi:arylesterase/paraoxonase
MIEAVSTKYSLPPSSRAMTGDSEVLGSRLPKRCCRKLGWIPGPEDIVIDHELGRAYVSSQIRRGGSRRRVNGSLLLLDLTRDDIEPRSLTGALEPQLGFFHPHGIDLFIDEHGRRRLFAINHRTETDHCIDIFDIEDAGAENERLVYRGRVSDDRYLTHPNDLVAVALDEFYFVNDRGWRSRIGQGVESALLLTGVGMGTLVHARLTDTGAIFTRIADGLLLPVGIEATPRTDPTRLYVASAGKKEILIYRRADDPEGAGWTASKTIALDAAPDNLSWDGPDKGGALWVAAHPDLLALTLHLLQVRESAPSRVLRIRNPDGQVPKVDLIFDDDGELLSASSIAALYRGKHRGANKGTARLLIGAPQEEHLLVCDVPKDVLG